jgi:hypothetical protein
MMPLGQLGLSPRRFKQQHRRRLFLLFGVQLLSFCHCAWTAASQETDQSAAQQHQHRKHVWPEAQNETDEADAYDDEFESSELSTTSQHKLRKHRSLFDDNNAHRALRRKEVPVNYRLYEDLLRNYNKAARPVRHPSQVVNVTM